MPVVLSTAGEAQSAPPVTIYDRAGNLSSLTVSNISIGAPTLSMSPDFTVTEGSPISGQVLALLNQGWTSTGLASIDWGDGPAATPAQVVALADPYSVRGSRVYADDGVYHAFNASVGSPNALT